MRALVVVGSVMVVQGCFAGAVEPWIGDADRVDAPQAVGTWTQEGSSGSTMEVTAGEGKRLRVVLKEKDHPAGTRWIAMVGKVGGATYVDTQIDADDEHVKAVGDYVVRPHFVMKATLDGDTMKLWMVDRDWFNKAVVSGKVKTPLAGAQHAKESSSKDIILFTGPTTELQKQLKKLEKEKDAYSKDPLVFTRQKG